MFRLAGAFSEEYYLDGLEKDMHIKKYSKIINVKEVILKFFKRIFL